MSIANTIAMQLDHTKPEHWTPGVDVGFKPVTQGRDEGLKFVCIPRRVHGTVMYDRRSDTYYATIHMPDGVASEYHGLHADQLGHIVWGADVAKPYVLPMMRFVEDAA